MVPTRAKTGPARRRWPLQNLLATESSRLARGGLNSALPSPIADRLAVRLSVVFIGARIGRRSVQCVYLYSHGVEMMFHRTAVQA